MAVFSGVEGVANYDAIYQHDALGWSRSIGYRVRTAWFAARYTSGGGGSVTAVSFYTPTPGASYEVRVAGSLAKVGASPVAGQGTLAVGGYRTVRLAAPAPVTAGSDFVAAVRLTTPGSRTPIPVEHPSKLIAPRAAAGRSFVSRDGVVWTDLRKRRGFGSSDVCLKAFVTASGRADRAAPRSSWKGRTRAAVPARASTSPSPTRRSRAAAPSCGSGCATPGAGRCGTLASRPWR